MTQDEFLHRFRRGLASLPQDIREDIVAEVRSHFAERGAALDLGKEFGTPEEYAAHFIAENALSIALQQGNPWRLVRALLATARYATVVVLGVIPLAILQFMAMIVTLLGVLKPFFWDSIGVFAGDDGRFRGFGMQTQSLSDFRPPTGVHETLGYAAMPVMILGGLLVFWISNRLTVLIARARLARLRA